MSLPSRRAPLMDEHGSAIPLATATPGGGRLPAAPGAGHEEEEEEEAEEEESGEEAAAAAAEKEEREGEEEEAGEWEEEQGLRIEGGGAEREEADEEAFDQWDEEERVAEEEEEEAVDLPAAQGAPPPVARPGVPDGIPAPAVAPDELAVTVEAPSAKKAWARKASFSLSFSRKGRANASDSK